MKIFERSADSNCRMLASRRIPDRHQTNIGPLSRIQVNQSALWPYDNVMTYTSGPLRTNLQLNLYFSTTLSLLRICAFAIFSRYQPQLIPALAFAGWSPQITYMNVLFSLTSRTVRRLVITARMNAYRSVRSAYSFVLSLGFAAMFSRRRLFSAMLRLQMMARTAFPSMKQPKTVPRAGEYRGPSYVHRSAFCGRP